MGKSVKSAKGAKRKKNAPIVKATPKQIYLVETLITYRMRYLVEDTCAEFVEDSITMNESAENPQYEWQQKYLGETILSTRPVSEKEIHAIEEIDGDNGPYERFVWKRP